MTELHVPFDDDGRRLDKVLRRFWPDIPLSALMKAIRTGEVRLDGAKAKADVRVAEGQTLRAPWELHEERSSAKTAGSVSSDADLSILYRDEHLLVIDKPAGLLSQPDTGGGDSAATRTGATPVHRLDRNTSGVLLLARNGVALRLLQEAWRRGEVRKTYLALCAGDPGDEGRVDAPLFKVAEENLVCVDSAGQPAVTLWRNLAPGRYASLLELELLTGRPHQARAHMAHLGCPILGDVKYCNDQSRDLSRHYYVKRPLLHAVSLELPPLPPPLDHLSEAFFEAPLPHDFEKALYRAKIEIFTP